jgi:hypothetical protein
MRGTTLQRKAAEKSMPSIVICNCGARFQATDSLAGRTVGCPTCGASLAVPMPSDPLFGENLPRCGAASRVLTRTAIPPSPKRPVRKERRADQSASTDSRQAGLWSGVGLMVLGVAITAWAAVTSDGSLGGDQLVGIGITGIVLGGILAAFFALGGRKR